MQPRRDYNPFHSAVYAFNSLDALILSFPELPVKKSFTVFYRNAIFTNPSSGNRVEVAERESNDRNEVSHSVRVVVKPVTW